MRRIIIYVLIVNFILFSTFTIYAQEQTTEKNAVNLEQKVLLLQNRIGILEEKITKTLENQQQILEALKTLKIRISRQRGRRASHS